MKDTPRGRGGPHSCAQPADDAGHVVVAPETVLGATAADEVAGLFRLLGDAGRVRMLSALLESGELCVGELAAAVGSAESTVSHSLRLLRTAGVVRHRRAGRHVFYRLDDDHVRLLLQLSIEHIGHREPS